MLLDRSKSAAGKGTEAPRKTDLGNYSHAYGHAISLLNTFEPGKGVTTVVDAALLAVKPSNPLPADSTSPPVRTEGKLRRQ